MKRKAVGPVDDAVDAENPGIAMYDGEAPAAAEKRGKKKAGAAAAGALAVVPAAKAAGGASGKKQVKKQAMTAAVAARGGPVAPPAAGPAAAATESRVVYVGHVPHGFYEEQMRGFFTQFGEVTRLRLSRNKKTAASKHYAFVEFASGAVAAIAAEAMDKYLMFGHILDCHVIPHGQLHPDTFNGANRKFKRVPWRKLAAAKHNAPRGEAAAAGRVERLRATDAVRAAKIKAAGIDYDFGAVGYAAAPLLRAPPKKQKTLAGAAGAAAVAAGAEAPAASAPVAAAAAGAAPAKAAGKKPAAVAAKPRVRAAAAAGRGRATAAAAVGAVAEPAAATTPVPIVAPKQAPKAAVKAAVKTAAKTEAKTEAKVAAKPAAKTAAKTPAKAEAKTPAKPAAKSAPKPAAKPAAKSPGGPSPAHTRSGATFATPAKAKPAPAAAAAVATDSVPPPFAAAKKFGGSRVGAVFKSGPRGLGYYADGKRATPVGGKRPAAGEGGGGKRRRA